MDSNRDALRRDLERNLEHKLNVLLSDTIKLFEAAEVADNEAIVIISMILVHKLVASLAISQTDPGPLFAHITTMVKHAQQDFLKFKKERQQRR